MYLWKHRGFDPALRKHYSEHVTLFNDMKENILIQDSVAAADWCRKATFDGGLKLPGVLSKDREEKKEVLREMDTWDGELDEGSPAELFIFVFKKKDYKCCEEKISLQTFCKITVREQ